MKKLFLITFLPLILVLSACTTQTPAPEAVVTSAPAVQGTEVKVNISGFAFDPASLTIKVGETVTWTNQDSAAHTVAADDNSWQSGTLEKGVSFSRVFDTAGIFTYKCGVHPSMKGTVIVEP